MTKSVFRNAWSVFGWVFTVLWTGALATMLASVFVRDGWTAVEQLENGWVAWLMLLAGAVFTVLALRRPYISVTLESGVVTAEERWLWGTRRSVHPVAEIGGPTLLDEDDGDGGRIYKAALTLPDGRRIVFSENPRRKKVEAAVERFRRAAALP